MTTNDGARMLLGGVLVLSLAWAPHHRAEAAGASDELRPAIDRVVRILADPAMKGELKRPERRSAVRGVMESAIDFPEAARRALAMHWRIRTQAERDEFTALFKDLVLYSYIRLMEPYAGETVRVIGESESDGTVTVLTRVVRRQGEPVPVEYRMHLVGSRWLVYDVVVEGVSLVANYRAQFHTIIQTSSYAELLRRVRARIAELGELPAASVRTEPRG